MLDLLNLSLEDVERLCQAGLSWELVPLYYYPGKGGEARVVFGCSQLAIWLGDVSEAATGSIFVHEPNSIKQSLLFSFI